MILEHSQLSFERLRFEKQPTAVSQEVLDKGILTRAADVFSFALIIWSLVAGEVRASSQRDFSSEQSCHALRAAMLCSAQMQMSKGQY